MKLQDELIDSLKSEMNFRITYLPPNLRKVNLNNLPYFNINKAKKQPTIVYVISDFNCHTCKENEKKANEIIEKYKDNVEFRFIYYSSYVNPNLFYLCGIANENRKFKEIKQEIFNSFEYLNEKDSIQAIFKKNRLPLNDKLRMESNLKLIKTKDFLIKNKIYSTPTYVVNSIVLDQEFAIDILEELIIKQIKK